MFFFFKRRYSQTVSPYSLYTCCKECLGRSSQTAIGRSFARQLHSSSALQLRRPHQCLGALSGVGCGALWCRHSPRIHLSHPLTEVSEAECYGPNLPRCLALSCFLQFSVAIASAYVDCKIV